MRAKSSTVFAAAIVLGCLVQPALAQNTGSISHPTATPGTMPQANVAAVPANANPPIPGTMQPGIAKPVAYQDHSRGFMLVAPAGARFQERKEGNQIAIQSRKGYAVNIQVGDANQNVPTVNMFAKLEAQYLGDGKPWARKTAENETVIAGLPAGVAQYEAGSTRTEVIIVRGMKTDFVFMFFAPMTHFEKLTTEFEWIMASFRPAPDEKPSKPVVQTVEQLAQKPQPQVRAEPNPVANPAGRPAPKQAMRAPDMAAFAEAGYGYQVEYPHEWQLEKLSAFTNVISGPQGTPAYDAIVALQNVKPESLDGDAAQIAFNDLKSKLSQQAGVVDFVGEKPVTYAKHGLTLQGRQFVANYAHEGRQFRKWALVLPRPEGGVAHIWSYTAPAAHFEAYRPVAERILNSLKIDGGQS